MDISGATAEWQQRRYWSSARRPISVRDMTASRANHRKAKPTPADVQAAARLRAIWDAIPRDRRPTQEDAAALLGCNQSAISQYRNAHIPLNARAVVLFAELLGCPPTDIRDDLPELAPLKAQVREPAATYQPTPDSPSEDELDREWRDLPHDLKAELIGVVRLARQISPSRIQHPRSDAAADRGGLDVTKLGLHPRGKRRGTAKKRQRSG